MDKSNFKFLSFAGALIMAVGAAFPLRAQDQNDLKRGVARISLMDGEVSVRRGDTGEWVAGVINAPLMTDDRISTGQNSRAEIEFDSANVLRIGGNAEIHLALLENGNYKIEIPKGTVTFRVLRPSNAAVELNTPSVSVRPTHEGTFRITVTEDGESEITARSGDVEVFTPKGTQWVYAGQTMMARGDPSDPEFQMTGAIPIDDWDRWNDSRDQTLDTSKSYQYVPQGVYGAEDLDSAGTGLTWRHTDMCGGRLRWRRVGRRTGWGGGCGWIGMAGLGLATNRGVGRHIIMAAGFSMPVGLGVVSGRVGSAALLVAGDCRLLWIRRWGWRRGRLRLWQYWLGSAGSV